MLTTGGVTSCSPHENELFLAIPESLIPICDPTAIVEIGDQYLQMVPEYKEKAVLVKELTEGIQGTSSALSDHLEEKVMDDFSRGNLVEVSGWMLSRTEARQCALYSLLKS